MSSPPPVSGAPISPVPIEPGRPPGGCARGGLIGCGVAAILVLILLVAFLAYARRKPEALTDLMMGQIERNLASDVTAEEKRELRSAYARFRRALQERRVGREPIDRMRSTLSSVTATVSREQVRELTRVFNEAAAAPPRTPTTPVAAPAFSPTP